MKIKSLQTEIKDSDENDPKVESSEENTCTNSTETEKNETKNEKETDSTLQELVYSCTHCSYRTTFKRSLDIHTKAIHTKIRDHVFLRI